MGLLDSLIAGMSGTTTQGSSPMLQVALQLIQQNGMKRSNDLLDNIFRLPAKGRTGGTNRRKPFSEQTWIAPRLPHWASKGPPLSVFLSW